MQTERLGIIVPYRNRYEHLEQFKESITKYLEFSGIDYRLIIVQQDDAKLFNRGMLLNIGFKYAKKNHCNYVVFHDIDMLPIKVDYSPSPHPIHLATDFQVEEGEKHRETFDNYFGGVTMFSIDDFEKIDGYSNKYWGWGYEDDDLFLRCKLNDVQLEKKQIKNISKNTQIVKFNGIDAYIKAKNIIDLSNDFSITICFEPDDLKLDHTKNSDEYSIFSIPGYDFAISYTSFNRYNFCVFDNTLNAVYLNTEIKPNYKTNITLTYDTTCRTITMYQDGKFIGETTEIKRFNPKYRKEEYFYLGVGNPNRETIPNWFKGYFEYFAYYDKVLGEEEIIQIVENKTNLLNKDFGNYKSSSNLQMYYDTSRIRDYRLTDLSKNYNVGELINCEVINMETDPYIETEIPYRRKSIFKSLKHEENGFNGNRWKDDNTRWNQLRFVNEIKQHHELIQNDGLSTLEFVLHGIEKINKNIQIINVGI